MVIIASFMFVMVYQARLGGVAVSRPVAGQLSPGTSARSMATIEASTGRVLYVKNPDAKLPMASTTKILTAITVIENVACLDEVVQIHDKAIGVEGSSIYIRHGEKLTVRELLYGLMLRSGNDTAVALAMHVSKSIPAFADLMNETARKAGAMNSNFKNPHGLDEEGHYTTAMDLALVSAYAMRNAEFAKISATKDVKISGVEYPRAIQNKNKLLRSNKYAVGVKTGFTTKAGRTFVGAMTKGNMTVVCVVLNCGPMFPESEALMTAALNEFYMQPVLLKDTIIAYGDVKGIVTEDFSYPIRAVEEGKLSTRTFEKGKRKFIEVTFDGKVVHTQELAG